MARAAYVFAGGDKETSTLNIQVNSTLVKRLVHCFTSGWNCPHMSTYVKQEVTNLAEYLNDEVKATVPIGGPNMYTGPLEYSSNGGLPLIRKYSKNGRLGSWKMFARCCLFLSVYSVFSQCIHVLDTCLRAVCLIHPKVGYSLEPREACNFSHSKLLGNVCSGFSRGKAVNC